MHYNSIQYNFHSSFLKLEIIFSYNLIPFIALNYNVVQYTNCHSLVLYTNTVSFQLIWPTCDFLTFSKNLRKLGNFISRVRKKWGGTGDSLINLNGTVISYHSDPIKLEH